MTLAIMDVLLYTVLGLLILYIILRIRGNGQNKGRKIPSPPGWPIVGNSFEMNKGTVFLTFYDLAEKYGEIVKLNVFGRSAIVLNSAELIRTAFNTSPYKNHMNDRIHTFVGEYVIFKCTSISFTTKSHGSAHSDIRKAFTRGMHIYGEGRQEFEDKVQSELVSMAGRIEKLDGAEFNMVEVLKRSLTNIISIILGGHDLKDDDKDLNMFWDFDRTTAYLLRPDSDAVLRTFPFLRFVPGVYKQQFDENQRAAQTIIKRYVTEKKATYQPGKIRGFVDFMLKEQMEAKNEGREPLFYDDRLYAVTLEIVGAGILTTLSSLSALFLCLMNYPEYQVKIQEELDRVVGRDRLPKLSDKQKCVFIEAVIMEGQRYCTVIPLALPHCCEPNIEFEGYNIPPKSVIMPNIWYVHHDKKIWGDPWNFRPERFLDDKGDLLPNDHVLRMNLMPFSTGRRQCIGEHLARSRIFLYVATLLQRWNFEMIPDHFMSCDPRQGDNFEEGITICPKPYFCKVIPRK